MWSSIVSDPSEMVGEAKLNSEVSSARRNRHSIQQLPSELFLILITVVVFSVARQLGLPRRNRGCATALGWTSACNWTSMQSFRRNWYLPVRRYTGMVVFRLCIALPRLLQDSDWKRF